MRVYKKILYVALSVLVCAIIFTATAFFLLYDFSAPTDNAVEKVPYYRELPTEAGLLFCFEEGGSVFLNLNFEENETRVILLPHDAKESDVAPYGYRVFKTVKTDYECLSTVIDRIGGIELADDTHGQLRYTGVQITDKLSHTAGVDVRREIVKSVFKKIEKGAVTKETVVFLIEHSVTTLSFPDVYEWLPHLQSVAANLQFIN